MTQWASVLPGFDCTKHQLSNVKVAVEGDKAQATCDVEATHVVVDKTWMVSGHYSYKLARVEDVWRITYHKFELTDEHGSRDVMGLAAANVETNPPSYLVRRNTLDAVRIFLMSLEQKDMNKFADV